MLGIISIAERSSWACVSFSSTWHTRYLRRMPPLVRCSTHHRQSARGRSPPKTPVQQQVDLTAKAFGVDDVVREHFDVHLLVFGVIEAVAKVSRISFEIRNQPALPGGASLCE